MNPPIKFGTDGWRAIIGRDYTFENVAKVIQAYCDLQLESGKTPPKEPVILGYDRRFLSDEFAREAAAVLAGNDIPVSLAQSYEPTPCVSWMTKVTKAPVGIVITASHNPYPWNGVKFKESYGGSASPEYTGKIEKRIEANDKLGRRPRRMDFDQAVGQGKVTFHDPTKDYVRQLQSQLDLKRIREAGWKIGYDAMYGAGAGFVSRVVDGEGKGVREIRGESNPGFGGINPEPIEKNLKALLDLVRNEKLDVGLATDGDADRIGAVDEDGIFVNPQQIYSLLLWHLLEKGLRGDVVRSVTTTRMIGQIALKYDVRVHETPVGFKHICSKFLEINPLIGGEESGGISIPTHVYERDGILSGLLLVEMMSQRKKRLRVLLADLEKLIGPSAFLRDDLHLKENEIVRAREAIAGPEAKEIGNLKVASVNRLDGIKYVLEDGSTLLLRASGTEPVVRLYAESNTRELSRKLLDAGCRLLAGK